MIIHTSLVNLVSSVVKQKSLCEDLGKTNSFCIFVKYLAYHLKSFRVPPVVSVPQVGNPWFMASRSVILLLLFNSAFTSKHFPLHCSTVLVVKLDLSQLGKRFKYRGLNFMVKSVLKLKPLSAHETQDLNQTKQTLAKVWSKSSFSIRP